MITRCRSAIDELPEPSPELTVRRLELWLLAGHPLPLELPQYEFVSQARHLDKILKGSAGISLAELDEWMGT